MKNTKSPLLKDPLRLPGQSLEEQIQRVIERQVTERVVFLGFFLTIAVFEWFRWALDIPYQPVLFTIVFVVVFAVLVPGFLRTRIKLRDLKLGRDGERAVGQTLERLRVDGYHVFHDIVGPDWNIDHILVGPGGVFAIDTKTYSKPMRGRAVLVFTSDGLSKGTFDLNDDLIQARAEARSLTKIIGEATGKSVDVRPVVTYPGWYIESDGTQPTDLWVLETKALLKWVRRQEIRFDESQVRLIRNAISDHARNSYRNRHNAI